MTEQQFRAPPVPPKATSFEPVRIGDQAETKVVVRSDDLPSDHFAAAMKLPTSVYRTKVVIGIFVGILIVGMVLGAMMFGGSAPVPQQRVGGLDGTVIANPDWGRLPRCGSVSETAACTVYYVNHSRNDRQAEDFFNTAVAQTGRSEYLIRIENPHYAKTRIPPGYIAQIRIPPLR